MNIKRILTVVRRWTKRPDRRRKQRIYIPHRILNLCLCLLPFLMTLGNVELLLYCFLLLIKNCVLCCDDILAHSYRQLHSPRRCLVADMSQSIAAANSNCRNTTYPRSHVDRFPVPDDKVDWSVEWPEYAPPTHTSPGAIGKPWSDPEHSDRVDEDGWNKCMDKINRVSHIKPYAVDEHGPRNPVGRTGIRGRGCLGRWGPNHAADPIVTRWKRDERQEKVKDEATRLYVLQFIAIQRRDTKEWAIPGGMIDPGELVSETLRREFGEEAMNSLEADSKQKERLKTQVSELFRHGSEVYRGYVDDPRNTDNSWMETVAYHFHDEDGSSVGQFHLHAGDDAVGVQWLDISRHIKLFASHNSLIQAVAERLKAHW